jgi:serine/threonine-protein kinase
MSNKQPEPEEGTESIDAFLVEAVCSSRSPRQDDLDRALPTPGTLIGEKYRLERLLGQGAMGAVFSAVHLVTGKRVAVKWLHGTAKSDPKVAALLTREARAIGRINHPNVVTIYDAGFADGRPYIAMELLDGESLEERIRRAPLPVGEGVQLMLGALRGVAAAHAAGVIHRDLKPANIFVCRSVQGEVPRTKVLDFGISKMSAGEGEDLVVTTGATPVGTPMYMAPEQICVKSVDERTDVYAASVTLYYAFTGRFPFEARTRHELFPRVLQGRPLALSEHRADLPAALCAVIMKGLQREPARRYQSVEAMLRALEPFERAPLPSTRRWTRRALAIAAALVLASAALAAFLRPDLARRADVQVPARVTGGRGQGGEDTAKRNQYHSQAARALPVTDDVINDARVDREPATVHAEQAPQSSKQEGRSERTVRPTTARSPAPYAQPAHSRVSPSKTDAGTMVAPGSDSFMEW